MTDNSSSASSVEDALTRLLNRVDCTIHDVGDRFPLFADPHNGRWTTSRRGSWTPGFWAGTLWLRAYCTGRSDDVSLARTWCRRLEQRLFDDTASRAMTFWYGAALGALLFGEDEAAGLALRGARALADAFNPSLGAIPVGSAFVPDGSSLLHIDSVGPTIALLDWANERSGVDMLRHLARHHLARHVSLCLRLDGAVIPSVGRKQNIHWYPTTSTPGWSRGHAWAILALAEASARIDRSYLARARNLVDYWRVHVAAGTVPPWHFADPAGVPDTSAAVITAAALLRLDQLDRSLGYWALAADLVRAVLPHLTPCGPGDARPAGMLVNGCYDHCAQIATRAELIWGDFYLLLVLSTFTGAVPPSILL